MRRLNMADLPDDVATALRTHLGQEAPVALVDASGVVGWIMSHREYARLVELANRGAAPAGGEAPAAAPRDATDAVLDVDDTMAARLHLRHQL